MRFQLLLCAGGVSLSDRFHNGTVFMHGAHGGRGAGQEQPVDQRQGRSAIHLDQSPIAREFHEAVVEASVGLAGAKPIVLFDEGRLLFDRFDQWREMLGFSAAFFAGTRDRRGLECQAHVHDLADVLIIEHRHDVAGGRRAFDEAFRFESGERLANRRATDADLTCPGGFAQALAFLDLLKDQRLAQGAVGVVALRRGGGGG